MPQSLLTFTLVGRNDDLDPPIDVYFTVFLQGQTVTSTIALSAVTHGVDLDQRVSGFAAAFITKAGIVVNPRRTDNLPLDPRDTTRNQLRIVNCSFVTFRLVLALAQAYAVATIFSETSLAASKLRTVQLSDGKNGKVVGIHHVAFPEGGRVPSDALILRRVRSCAAEAWKVESRTLHVALAKNPGEGSKSAAPAKGRNSVQPSRPNLATAASHCRPALMKIR